MKALGYVRVSRVGGRGGDSFLSPELQRESIERVCQRERLELVDVVEELDKGGGDAARPLWNECIERIERGEARALVVWNLSRFARSILDAKRAIDRIEGAGGRLYSEEGAEGLSRDILLVVAEHERLRHADAFQRAGASAVERGLHFASRVPTGYTRDPETRRLVPDEMAPTVRGLFEKRAAGWGWVRLARWFVRTVHRCRPRRTQGVGPITQAALSRVAGPKRPDEAGSFLARARENLEARGAIGSERRPRQTLAASRARARRRSPDRLCPAGPEVGTGVP